VWQWGINMCIRKINKDDRVMIFLDHANVKYGLEEHEGLENCLIAHLSLANTLIRDRNVAGAIAFDTDYFFRNNQSVSEYLSEVGYKIVKGHYVDFKQKEVDVSIAVEMLMHAVNDHYDVAVLISGDRDFIPAIHAIQSLGKKVELAAFRNNTSDEVIHIVDEFTDLSAVPMVYYFPSDNNVVDEFEEFGTLIDHGGDPEFETLENVIKETENCTEVIE
jgi:uncharacterized LabA/DUF88 family protein